MAASREEVFERVKEVLTEKLASDGNHINSALLQNVFGDFRCMNAPHTNNRYR